MMFNGFSETSITIERLPVYYKQVRTAAAAYDFATLASQTQHACQLDAVAWSVYRSDATLETLSMQRDNLFFPPWAFGLPGSILRLPYSLTEAIIYVRHPCLVPASCMHFCQTIVEASSVMRKLSLMFQAGSLQAPQWQGGPLMWTGSARSGLSCVMRLSLCPPCALQTGIVYYMVDLAPEASRFFTFLFIMFLVSAARAVGLCSAINKPAATADCRAAWQCAGVHVSAILRALLVLRCRCTSWRCRCSA